MQKFCVGKIFLYFFEWSLMLTWHKGNIVILENIITIKKSSVS